MIYETFNPEIHDTFKVAELVYDVDYRTFDMLFRDKNKAISALEKYLKKKKVNSKFKVILDGHEIIGMLMIFTHDMPHEFYLKSLKLVIVDILDYFVLCDIEKDDFYIAEIAIDESQRGNGIGRKVIDDAVNYAKSKGFKRVILDADFRNLGAKSLYERLGFKVFNKKRVKIGSFERGMYNMELLL